MAFLFVPIFFAEDSFSQKSTREKIDSTKQEIRTLSGASKFESLKELFVLYDQIDYKKSFETAVDAQQVALDLQDTLLMIRALRMQGYALGNGSKNAEAIKVFEEALSLAEPPSKNLKIKAQIKYILNSLAVTYTDMGNYSKALNYNLMSLTMRQQEGDKNEESIALNNIGLVYFRLEDYQKALEYYNECLAIKQQSNPAGDDEQFLLLTNIALCYINLGDIEKGIDLAKQSVKKCHPNCSQYIEREALNCMGLANLKLGDNEQAEKNLTKSLEIARAQNNIPSIVSNLVYLGKLFMTKGYYKKSAQFLKEAETIAADIKYPKIRLDIYFTFYQLFQKEQRLELSSNYQTKYMILNDSINKDLLKNMRDIQIEYAEHENLKTIADKNQIILLNQQLLSKQKNQLAFTISIAILLMLSAVLLFRSYQAKQRANQLLEQRVLERTQELANAHSELNHRHQLTQSKLQHVLGNGHSMLASIDGLILLAERDKTNAAEYHKEINQNFQKLITLLKGLR